MRETERPLFPIRPGARLKPWARWGDLRRAPSSVPCRTTGRSLGLSQPATARALHAAWCRAIAGLLLKRVEVRRKGPKPVEATRPSPGPGSAHQLPKRQAGRSGLHIREAGTPALPALCCTFQFSPAALTPLLPPSAAPSWPLTPAAGYEVACACACVCVCVPAPSTLVCLSLLPCARYWCARHTPGPRWSPRDTLAHRTQSE